MRYPESASTDTAAAQNGIYRGTQRRDPQAMGPHKNGVRAQQSA